MIKEITLFDNLYGDGETHQTTIQVKDAKKIIFSIDYDYPPEHDDFIDEGGQYDGQPTYFRLTVGANICNMPFSQIGFTQLKNIYDVTSIETSRGLYYVDVEGFQNIKFELYTEPPTNYNTSINVKAVLVG